MTKIKRLMESVNTVLFEHWDPIGINRSDSPWPRDEYESYVGSIISLVRQGASDDAIAEHLGSLNRPHRNGPESIAASA